MKHPAANHRHPSFNPPSNARLPPVHDYASDPTAHRQHHYIHGHTPELEPGSSCSSRSVKEYALVSDEHDSDRSCTIGLMGKKKAGKRTAEVVPVVPSPPPPPLPAEEPWVEEPSPEPAPSRQPPRHEVEVEVEVQAEAEEEEELGRPIPGIEGDIFPNEYSERNRSSSPIPSKPRSAPSHHRPPPPPPPPPPRLSPPINGVSSPALSALADDNYDDPSFDTRAWARNIPFGLSPPNPGMSPRESPANRTPSTAALGTSPSAPAFSLAGSPPATSERPRPLPTEDARGGFAGPAASISPRPSFRHPSRQSADNYSLSASPRGRPVSMQYPGSLPAHRPQAHFRGLSEAEIGMTPARSVSGLREGGPLVLFDQAYYDGHVGDVVVVASGNSLHVSRLEREKLIILGTLSGLRGTILAAKMLPPSGERTFEPMISLIVHGPALISGGYEEAQQDMDAGARPRLSEHEAQTTVEIYGIKSGRHLATLYKSPPVNLGPRASLQDPATSVGALMVHVSASFVTVTSGQSGEVYIFRSRGDGDDQTFVCLGKTWTSMPAGRQRSYSVSSTSSMSTAGYDDVPGSQNAPERGIISLSHRWLAVVPPPASSQTSLQGEVGVPGKSTREPPGLLSHTSPAQPSTNCEADTSLDEGFINKFARDAAQEAMKGAKRAGEAGYQAFRNYWNKTDGPSATDSTQYNTGYGAQPSSFPPTHAQDNPNRQAQSTTLVSIVDLERLTESNDNRPGMLVQPAVTFPVKHGCSFVSFNPTGLSLFTSSAKGDVSYVWCLMRMIHGTVATPHGDISQADNHASVRQIARFNRFTTSNIVDVIWTKPIGEKLGILTERGTVHIHDLPASAFRWPPPVRHLSPATTPGNASESSSQQAARSRLGDALSFMQGTAQSFSTAKLRSSLTGTTFSGLAASAGVKGGRMMAAGFSKSVEAASGTMSNIRHMGENRISLPGGRKARVMPGVAALLSGKYQDAIAIIGDGSIKLHAIRLSVTDGGKGKRSVAGEQINSLSVPKVDELNNTVVGLDGLSARGQWFADVSAQVLKPGQVQPQPLSFAEIETSTPYRTFHNDHRVSMNVYADDAKMGDEISDDWVFGDDIDTEPVGEDQLPAGSMHLGREREEKRFEDTFKFEDEELHAVPQPKVTKSDSKSAKQAKKQPAVEYNYDDLIDMQEDIEASQISDLSSMHARRTRAAIQAGMEEEEEAMPFGGGSEFGY